jgi:hypothetical protein
MDNKDSHLDAFTSAPCSINGGDLIGELAPLLSVLGHEKHKRHKSATRELPDWDAVLSVFCHGRPRSI